ncbi:uncharacterized protein LOC135500672 [Lineus longissimus]|uniref:uncharacterized protein LOC135500672 n=1 Tax=Lineus longissimus TaxID=88925 RepID=UPI00315D94C1
MAAQKRERSKREPSYGETLSRESARGGGDGTLRLRKPPEQRVEDDYGNTYRKPRPERPALDSVNTTKHGKDYIVEHTKFEPRQNSSHVKPATPKLSHRSSLRYNLRYDNSSDIYTHIEEDLEQDIKPEDDFNRSLLIAQSGKSSKRKTNSVRFKLDLGDASDDGTGEGQDWRRRKQYADSIVSDTDQSLTSCRGIIRNLGCLSDRTGYRSHGGDMEFVEMEHAGSKTWRPSTSDAEGVTDEIDVIDISKKCDSYVTDDVMYPSAEERAKLQSASKARRRLLQEKRRSRAEPEETGLSGEESDWVLLPSLVFRDDSDAPPREKRSNSGRRRRRKRRSDRSMEKPGIEKVLSNMSEEAKLAIDAILAEMEQDKSGDVAPRPSQRSDHDTRGSRYRKHTILRENSGKFASIDDGVDSGFLDTDTSNNLNSRSSGSEEYQKVGISDRVLSKSGTAESLENTQSSEKYRSKTARSRTPTKFPMIHSDLDYALDDTFTESSMPSRQNIPGLGTYRFPRMREKTFKITPPGYDSRYADMPRYEAPQGEDLDPTITAKAKEKCNQWLDQQYLPSLS